MSTTPASSETRRMSQQYLFPLIMVTVLFFLWGFCHSMLDVLNRKFQGALDLSLFESGFIQFASYIAYFLMATPAAIIARRFGYKGGILAGLALVVTGAVLFIPGALVFKSFLPFLVALFILFSGLTFLETTANPYVTVLGPPRTAASRLVLSQSFNGVGWIVGPTIGGWLILAGSKPAVQTAAEAALAKAAANDLSSLVPPYAILAVFVLIVAAIFAKLKLPEISGDIDAHGAPAASGAASRHRSLLQTPHFIGGVLAQLCYVGAQSAIFAFAINYFIDNMSIQSDKDAAYWLSAGMALFTIGRFSGALILRFVSPPLLLALYAIINVVLMGLIIPNAKNLSYIPLLTSFFFMSIMFPTIFSISLRNLGEKTKTASSWLVMSIIGGALSPLVMGRIVTVNPKVFKDAAKSVEELAPLHAQFSQEIGWSFLVPMALFVYIAIYGLMYQRLLARTSAGS